jgi:hypothetical protein
VAISSNTDYTYKVVTELTNLLGLDVLPDGSMLVTEEYEPIHFNPDALGEV